MKKALKISEKLVRIRETAREFYKEKYAERLEPYTEIVRATMKANELSALEAFLKIEGTQTYRQNALAQMMFIAAAVDLAEKHYDEAHED